MSFPCIVFVIYSVCGHIIPTWLGHLDSIDVALNQIVANEADGTIREIPILSNRIKKVVVVDKQQMILYNKLIKTTQ